MDKFSLRTQEEDRKWKGWRRERRFRYKCYLLLRNSTYTKKMTDTYVRIFGKEESVLYVRKAVHCMSSAIVKETTRSTKEVTSRPLWASCLSTRNSRDRTRWPVQRSYSNLLYSCPLLFFLSVSLSISVCARVAMCLYHRAFRFVSSLFLYI